MRSAMAPETIVAAVAANTSWKKNLASNGTGVQSMGEKFATSVVEPSSSPATVTMLSLRKKPLSPTYSLPTLNIRPKPTAQNARLPNEKSSRFFMQMFTTFLARVRPASSRQKPACMNITRNPATSTHTVSSATPSDAMSVLLPIVGSASSAVTSTVSSTTASSAPGASSWAANGLVTTTSAASASIIRVKRGLIVFMRTSHKLQKDWIETYGRKRVGPRAGQACRGRFSRRSRTRRAARPPVIAIGIPPARGVFSSGSAARCKVLPTAEFRPQ